MISAGEKAALAACLVLTGGIAVSNWTDQSSATPNWLEQHVRDQRSAIAAFDTWLKTEATPEDWHRFVLGANWDFHETETFAWIASQPECDRATALLLYWKHSPESYLEIQAMGEEPVTQDDLELLALIREKWAAGGYTRARIGFDRVRDAWPLDYAEYDRRFGEQAEELLPAAMRIDLPGPDVRQDCCIEGIPRQFWPEDGDLEA